MRVPLTLGILTLLIGCGCGYLTKSGVFKRLTPALINGSKSERQLRHVDSLRPRPLAQLDPPLPTSLPVSSRFGEWTNLGPENFGGKVWDIAVSPVNANLVFAAYGDGGGLWKTTDGGSTWRIVNDTARNNTITSVSICATNPNVIIAGLGSPSNANTNVDVGLLKSVDGGVTWKTIGPNADPKFSFVDVKCSINDASSFYAANEQALYKTLDGGMTWKTLLTFDGNNWYESLPSIALNPSDPTTLLVWGAKLDVQLSNDAGNTWLPVGKNMDHSHPAAFAWSPSNPSIVYCEREGPTAPSMITYRSVDAGKTWTNGAIMREYEQGRYDQAMAVDPLNPNRVLTANSVMAESQDGLQSYQVISAGHGDFLKVVFAPSDPKIVYNGNDGGVWKSSQSGRSGTWARADVGARTNKSYGFAVDPVSGKIYLSPGDYGGLLYQPGKGWDNLGGSSEEWHYFYINPHDSNDIYQSGSDGILKVGASNAVWPNVGPDLKGYREYANRMVFHPTESNTIYSATGNGLFKSLDRGGNWTRLGPTSSVQPFAGYGGVQYFDVAYSEPNTIYAAFQGNGPTLWKTVDGGNTWLTLKNPIYSSLTSFAIDPRDSRRIYFTANTGVYLSTDGGVTVNSTANNLPTLTASKILIDPDDPSRLYLATVPGIMISEDSGGSWSLLGKSMPRGLPWFMQTVNRKLYVSNDQSIWMIDLSKLSNLPSIAVPSGVVDAASYSPGTTKGSWATIFGSSLSQTTRTWGSTDFVGSTFPTSLDGVRVFVNGMLAPVSFVSPGQVNFQVPTNLQGSSFTAQLYNSLGQSNLTSFTVQDTQPSLFLVGSERKYAAVTHSNGTLVAPVGYFGSSVNSSPAAPGETVILYASGFGETNPPVPSGQAVITPVPLAFPTTLSVSVGGKSAAVQFAGITIAGVYQVNFVVPSVSPGDAPLIASVGARASQTGIKLSVSP